MYNYYEVVAALEKLIALETVNGDRLFVLGLCAFIVICFNVFRRKEHV